MKKPLSLIILDGYGIAVSSDRNAITHAKTPFLDEMFDTYPNATIECSGISVGLPKGQMGNSEVGHTNMGAGRIVYQELTRISKDIEDGDFERNAEIIAAIDHAKKVGGTVHIMGLLSNGGVHSKTSHLYALLELCEKMDMAAVVHAFTDGRDVPTMSGADFLKRLQKHLGKSQIGTVIGRFYAMDRDNRAERTQIAYDALAYGKGQCTQNFVAEVEKNYKNGITDEFLKPIIAPDYKGIKPCDSVIFFNYRPDRARQITRAFTDKNAGVEGERVYPYFLCFTRYDGEIDAHVAFAPQTLTNTFGEYISKNGLTQLRIAETEKYAHVTFFFDGGVEKAYNGEKRVLLPSPKVNTYDEKPEMSAYEVAKAAVREITSGEFDVMVLNFANCDMLGHTGNFDAAVKAVETVSECTKMVVEAVHKMGGVCIITADHGNAECMSELDGSPFTAHTVNRVPIIITDKSLKIKDGGLCDIAPTMLDILKLPKPEEMTGKSLIVK